MGSTRLIVDDIRGYLKDKNILLAVIRTACDLEQLLFWKLFYEKDLHPELIDSWTLGRYIDWNLKLGLIDEKYSKLLREFNELRNEVAHHRAYIDNAIKNPQEIEKISKIVEEVVGFIESTSVEKDSQEKENIYIVYRKKHPNRK